MKNGNDSKKRITFKLIEPSAQTVNLAGSFNGWDPAIRPLKRDAKGLWKTSVTLPPGRYEYLFVVDGKWMSDPGCADIRTNEYGGQNSVVVV